jgi:acyl-coenzyme A thioesterase PaaI-like protein
VADGVTHYYDGDPYEGRRSQGGVGLCPGVCLQQGKCRIGILTEHLDGGGIGRFDLECPTEQTHGGGQAHGDWAPGVLCEMAGHTAILSGTPGVMGTLTVRYSRPVPVGQALVGHARVDGRDGKTILVSAAIASPEAGEELVTGSAMLFGIDATTVDRLLGRG